MPMKVDPHYHDDPNRRRPSRPLRVVASVSDADIHRGIADRMRGKWPLLDIGCGSGGLAAYVDGPYVGVDLAMLQLRGLDRPRAKADATRLPFADHTFG